MERIRQNPHNVPCPVIDTIDLDTLSYNGSPYSPIYVGKFNWELTFDWMPMQKQVAANRTSRIDPIRLVDLGRDVVAGLGLCVLAGLHLGLVKERRKWKSALLLLIH